MQYFWKASLLLMNLKLEALYWHLILHLMPRPSKCVGMTSCKCKEQSTDLVTPYLHIFQCHWKALWRFRVERHFTWIWNCGTTVTTWCHEKQTLQSKCQSYKDYDWSFEEETYLLSWTHRVQKKNINALPCLKVYIMLFPKHNSNTSAHQVILKSLNANCHYSFRRDAVNFLSLHFGWVIWIWQICF